MSPEQTLALFALGREAWNKWATERLADKAELRKSGASIESWEEAARATFKDRETDEHLDFSGFIFPAMVTFFRARLSGETSFSRAVFHGHAGFAGTEFSEKADFAEAEFKDYANFAGARFAAYANFSGARFRKGANFYNGRFLFTTSFDGVRFCEEATFWLCTFEGLATYRGTHFSRDAIFFGARAGAFDLNAARFDRVPDFTQARFDEAPRLDVAEIKLPSLWGSVRRPAEPTDAGAYRALRRLAVQGHDHECEQQFFAAELRALRGNPDRPWPNFLFFLPIRRAATVEAEEASDASEGTQNALIDVEKHASQRRRFWPGGARYWLGLLYEIFSDFGRSVDLLPGLSPPIS
jgi:hypothetical protein